MLGDEKNTTDAVLDAESEEAIPLKLFRNEKRMTCSHKKVALSLETKLQILQDFDSKLMSQTEIARKYGVSKSTVTIIIRNRRQLEEAIESSAYQPSRKRMRTGQNDDIEKALFAWFKQAKAMQTQVSGPLLMEVADQLATEMKINFTPSSGWLDRFKKRKGIRLDKTSPDGKEKPSVSTTASDNWWSCEFHKLLNDYSPDNIFSADETGIFYKCLPDKTLLSLKGEVCKRGTRANERLTVLLATNMTGTQKLPLLVVGNVLKPHCVKNTDSLPVEYVANSKSWMTATIFENWLRKMDRMFLSQGRSIALFINSCPAHSDVKNLKAVRLIFFPPNTTKSILRPCDQGIIHSLKKLYRKQVVEKYFLHATICVAPEDVEKFSINLSESLYMLRTAWNNVTETVVAKCFQLACFKAMDQPVVNKTGLKQEMQVIEEEDNDFIGIKTQIIFKNLSEIIPMCDTFEAFCAIDDNLIVCEEVSMKEIANKVTGDIDTDTDSEGREEEDEQTSSESLVSSSQAWEALQVLKRFSRQQEDGEDLMESIFQLDGTLSLILLKHLNYRS